MGFASAVEFVHGPRTRSRVHHAVSLFAGAGISDCGVEAAGFDVLAQVEANERRNAVAAANFPNSTSIPAKVEDSLDAVKEAVSRRRLDLLAATPPCQGLSSSNPSRGKRGASQPDEIRAKNALLLKAIAYITALTPRAFIAENVRAVLTAPISSECTVLDELTRRLPNYRIWASPINVADYGVPQDRRRALIVGIHRDERVVPELDRAGLAPWPKPTHGSGGSPWITVSEWFRLQGYEPLDSGPEGKHSGSHPLHKVPRYGKQRYRLIADIPSGSGRSAYENEFCPECRSSVHLGLAVCTFCGSAMFNRPVIAESDGSFRLIRGFLSSYRRMPSNQPAPTITTNTSHVGSDFKIHPFENRVLSVLECADLQTVPRWFDFSYLLERKLEYLTRIIIGEAFPPFVVFQVCEAIDSLLAVQLPDNLAAAKVARLGHRNTRNLKAPVQPSAALTASTALEGSALISHSQITTTR